MALWLTNEGFGNGADGTLTISSDTTDAPIDATCTGTSGTKTLSATNGSFSSGQIIFIHQTRKSPSGAGIQEINVIASYSAGTITTKYDLANTYSSGAQVLVVKQYQGITIQSSKTLTAKAWNGSVGGILALYCNGDVSVAGTITAQGKGYLGAIPSAFVSGNAGEGDIGAQVQQATANGNGGGGAPDSNGSGAGGGNGATGTNGTNTTGGNAVGVAALTTAFFGGGGGSADDISSGGGGGTGGNGGGLIIIFGSRITVTGSINANGTAGGTPIGTHGGGGGGGGGSILLKGQNLVLGSGLITASGESGGTGGSGKPSGGAGSAGRIHADYLTSISGTTTPTLDSTSDSSLSPSLFGGIL